MIKCQAERVQSLPIDQYLVLFRRQVINQVRKIQRGTALIEPVGHDGMMEMMHVDAQLMRSTCLRAQPQE